MKPKLAAVPLGFPFERKERTKDTHTHMTCSFLVLVCVLVISVLAYVRVSFS